MAVIEDLDDAGKETSLQMALTSPPSSSTSQQKYENWDLYFIVDNGDDSDDKTVDTVCTCSVGGSCCGCQDKRKVTHPGLPFHLTEALLLLS